MCKTYTQTIAGDSQREGVGVDGQRGNKWGQKETLLKVMGAQYSV